MSSDEILDVDTPEQMRIEFPLAGVGSRFLALLLDSVFQVVATVVLLLAVGLVEVISGGNLGTPWFAAILILSLFVVQFAYFAAFEAKSNGQTPGKRRFGLRVIKANGRPITAADAVARNFMRIIDSLPAFYAIGIATAMISPRRQRLGDFVAGTVVVHEHALVLDPAGLDLRPGAGAVPGRARLTPHELAVVESFLMRRNQLELDGARRRRLADELAARIAQRTGTPPAERPDAEAWLEALARSTRGA